jgi:nucleoid-associated protein EbfC
MNQAAMMKIKKMQKEMMEAQERIEKTVYTGTSGGMVTVSMTGAHNVTEVKIDPEAMESKEDIEMIEDALKAAFNDCIKQIEKASQDAMGGFNLGGFGGMF